MLKVAKIDEKTANNCGFFFYSTDSRIKISSGGIDVFISELSINNGRDTKKNKRATDDNSSDIIKS